MAVKRSIDPKPNQHKWCGILRSYDDSDDLLANQDYVYFKTNRVSHVISQGTAIDKILIVDYSKIDVEIDKVIDLLGKSGSKIAFDPATLREKMQKDCKDCQKEVSDKNKVIIILSIDNKSTSPLCQEINDIIEGKFTDPKWLAENSERKGSDDIILGMSLPF